MYTDWSPPSLRSPVLGNTRRWAPATEQVICDLSLRGREEEKGRGVSIAGYAGEKVQRFRALHRWARHQAASNLATRRPAAAQAAVDPGPLQPEQLSSSHGSQEGLNPRAPQTQLPLGAGRLESTCFFLESYAEQAFPVLCSPFSSLSGNWQSRGPWGVFIFLEAERTNVCYVL